MPDYLYAYTILYAYTTYSLFQGAVMPTINEY